jgi:uncharacterized membrane protein
VATNLRTGEGERVDLPAGGGPAAPNDGPGGRPRLIRWAPSLLAVVLFGVYTLYALLRHGRLASAGYDLGIFAQAVREYAHLNAPMVPIKGPGFNLLGDHFSPALAVLAPFYRLWPNVRVLLVAQAALLAVSAIAVTRLAIRRVGLLGGLAIGIGYGLSWGLQGAVAFDFHEVALAVPLLAFSLAALAEQRWRAALAWALPLVLVKEDLGLTVAAIGGYLLLRRQWRTGTAAVGVGLGAFLVSTLVVIPRLDHLFHTYRYWGVVTHGAANTASAPRAGDLWQVLLDLPRQAVTPAGKPLLLVAVLGITGFVALRSPLLLTAVPTLVWRLVSTNPLYWSTGPVHYNVVLMPIVFVALVDGLARLSATRAAPARVVVRLAPAVVLAVSLLALPRLALWDLTRPATYRTDQHATAARELASRIPSGARVSAGNYLVPLLVDRCPMLVLFPDVRLTPVDYVFADTTNLYGVPRPHDEQVAALAAVPFRGFEQVAERDGIVLFKRR